MNVTVVQSYRFPNCWTVQPANLERDERSDIIRIFRDQYAPDGSWACANAIEYCEENGHHIESYQVQHQFSDLDFKFPEHTIKIVLNRGKPAFFNGAPVA